MSDNAVLPIPNLALAQDYFVLSSPSLAHLHEMAPYYRIVTSTSALPLDQPLLERMAKENREELENIEEGLEEAKKTEGETDIADALRARANYLTKIRDKVRASQFLALLLVPLTFVMS